MNYKKVWSYGKEHGNMHAMELGLNQKLIQSHRIKGGINFDANSVAMMKLSPKAYVLYMYLILHPEYHPWAWSEEDVIRNTSLVNGEPESAFQELLKKGYMTPGEIEAWSRKYKTNTYHLWEAPYMRNDLKIAD